MPDIVEECRIAARRMEGWGRVGAGYDSLPVADHLTKAGAEIEKLRKEMKLLKAVNASLVARNVTLMLLLGAVVCGGFMAVLLRS